MNLPSYRIKRWNCTNLTKKAYFDPHKLDYEGLSKQDQTQVYNYIKEREMEDACGPKDLLSQATPYLKGEERRQ